LRRQRRDLESRRAWRIDQVSHVPHDEVPPYRLLERGVDCGVQVVHGLRREAGAEAIRVELLQVLRRELGQSMLANRRLDVQPDVLLVAHPRPLAELGLRRGEPRLHELLHGLSVDHGRQPVIAALFGRGQLPRGFFAVFAEKVRALAFRERDRRAPATVGSLVDTAFAV
jgi:hypothetical protein